MNTKHIRPRTTPEPWSVGYAEYSIYYDIVKKYIGIDNLYSIVWGRKDFKNGKWRLMEDIAKKLKIHIEIDNTTPNIKVIIRL